MQRFLKNMSIFLFVLLILPVAEVRAEVFELYTGEVKGAYRDLTVTKVDGEYFLHKEDLLPGDTIKGKYKITNTSVKDYELTLKSLITSDSPASWIKDDEVEKADDWIKNINLKLTLDGNIVYDGSADGSDNFTGEGVSDSEKKFSDGIVIGKISKHSDKMLEAEFTIPESLDNEYQEAWARVDWIFSAKWQNGGGGGDDHDSKPDPDPDPKPDPDPDPKPTPDSDPIPNPGATEIPDNPLPAAAEIPDEAPNTGDSVVDIVIYAVITLGALAGILLVIFSKKKEV